MKLLVQEKARAVELRKQGFTYKEILAIVTVSKSTLSGWLKDSPLTPSERLALKHRRNSQITKGRMLAAGALRKRRLEREQAQYQEAQNVFQQYKDDHRFHSGISLYWAEGAKRSGQWQFVNSDVEMVLCMLRWLQEFTDTPVKSIQFRLFVHKLAAYPGIEDEWARRLGVKSQQFLKTIYKSVGFGVKKRLNYQGCIRVEVRKSKSLLNKMRFWQKMLVDDWLDK
jgi:predicted GNAT family N-acyltransferase